MNIIYSSENNDTNNNNSPKIKRCKNPYENNIEFMKDSYYNNLMNEFNSIFE